MNIVELKTFLAIEETGSLVKASAILNVTQSTVTARLQSLENTLGQVLFVRHKSGASLTPAGMRLLRYAETISDLWRQARQETALPSGLDGICNIACEHGLWDGFTEAFFSRLRHEHPDVAISVWQGTQGEIAHWMDQGKSDLAITHRSSVSKRQLQVELPSDLLRLYSTDPNSPIKFDPGYVFIEAGEEFGREHAAAYADADTARLSFNDASLGLQHILKFGGSVYLPERTAAPFIKRKEIFHLSTAPDFERRVFMTVNKSARDAWPWFDQIIADVT